MKSVVRLLFVLLGIVLLFPGCSLDKPTDGTDDSGETTMVIDCVLTQILDVDTAEWVTAEANSDGFTSLANEDTFLGGETSWQVTATTDFDIMTITMNLNGVDLQYTYQRQELIPTPDEEEAERYIRFASM